MWLFGYLTDYNFAITIFFEGIHVLNSHAPSRNSENVYGFGMSNCAIWVTVPNMFFLLYGLKAFKNS